MSRFAAAIANAERSAQIDVPAVDVDGRVQKIGVVLGPASQLFSEPVIAETELEDDGFVEHLEALTQHLVAVSGVDPTP